MREGHGRRGTVCEEAPRLGRGRVLDALSREGVAELLGALARLGALLALALLRLLLRRLGGAARLCAHVQCTCHAHEGCTWLVHMQGLHVRGRARASSSSKRARRFASFSSSLPLRFASSSSCLASLLASASSFDLSSFRRSISRRRSSCTPTCKGGSEGREAKGWWEGARGGGKAAALALPPHLRPDGEGLERPFACNQRMAISQCV